MKAYKVWKAINESLQRHLPVMLLYVLESRGSSPGRQGFCMAITAEGAMTGSIGGGIMEYKLAELSKELLKEDKPVAVVRKQVHNKEAVKNQSGMICSGEQTVFLYRVKAEDAGTVQAIMQHRYGILSLSIDGLHFVGDQIISSSFSFTYHNDGDWLYREQTGYKNQLYIIGSGHCALALSKIMRTMDFYIHLYDDRGQLNTFETNEYAHEKKIVSGYAGLGDMIPQRDNIYIVIMTHGYRTDDTVIRSLQDKAFRYIGVLGSAKKIQKMMDDYKREGLNECWLNHLHAPIGISIKSKTPEEIAISIAAQIIEVKNN